MVRVYSGYHGPRLVTHRLCFLYLLLTASRAVATAGFRVGEPLEEVRQQDDTMPAILVSLESGSAGADALRIWSLWAQEVISGSSDALPNVWVLCSTPAVEASITALPHVQPLLVDGKSSWAAVLDNFMSQNGNYNLPGVGLLGEGALPHPDLARSAERIRQPLREVPQPTANITRSRASGVDLAGDHWLSDRFVAQAWCNRAMLEKSRLTTAGLEAWRVEDLPLLDAIAVLIRSNQEFPLTEQHFLVDGTKLVPSLYARAPSASFEVAEYAGWSGPPPGAASDSPKQIVNVNIGWLDLGLVTDFDDDDGGNDPEGLTGKFQLGDVSKRKSRDATSGTSSVSGMGKGSRIARAPWPPEYVLDTAVVEGTASATSRGLVVVNNVNCGYLDMATNFWRSVQKATGGGAKILFVAMDEVSFDFMDAMDPGCTTMHPSAVEGRRHSMKAGVIGDARFADEVLGRPQMVNSIISQGYTMLWSDSDVVWLNNPLPLLPQIGKDSNVDMMLQIDGRERTTCTCFMFVNPTSLSHKMLKLWEENIIRLAAVNDQVAFQVPLKYMRQGGLRVEWIPRNVAPGGNEFFDHEYEENYAEVHHNATYIVHNNWVKGHYIKKRRFKKYHMWSVEDVSFPECTERRV